jgi:hypothetical protein
MPLLADLIGFREPTRDLIVDLVNALEAESVEMIAGRKCFHATEARILEPPRRSKPKAREENQRLAGDAVAWQSRYHDLPLPLRARIVIEELVKLFSRLHPVEPPFLGPARFQIAQHLPGREH